MSVPVPTGPTVYALLLEQATERPADLVSQIVLQLVGDLEHRMTSDLELVLREVYISGVRDGFAQGVQRATDEPACRPDPDEGD